MREHSKVALAVFAAFFIILVVGIILSFRILLWPVLIGFLIAFILDPVVDYFEARKINRVLVISIIFIIIVLAFVTAVICLLQPITTQIQKMLGDTPAYIQLSKGFFLGIVKTLAERFPTVDWIKIYNNIIFAAGKYSTDLLHSIPGFFTNIFGIAASSIIIPFVTFFLLKDGSNIKKQVIGLVPNRYFEMTLTLFYKVHRQISSYIRGTLLDCSIVALLYAVGYSIIQVKYGILIGVIAGVANLIPYIGPWIAAGIPIISIVFDPGAEFPWWSVIVVVGIVQVIENNIIYPIVMGRSVKIHPLIIMLGLFVGGEVAGLFGMIMAVPVIAVLKVIAEVLYKGLKQYSIV